MTDSTGTDFHEDASPKVLLIEGWIAGVRYYDAARVVSRLAPGQVVSLRRELNNSHDGNAIEILTGDEVKLGYIPRMLNPGIARRLDAGFSLSCVLISIFGEGEGLAIQFKVLSSTPGDHADPPLERPVGSSAAQELAVQNRFLLSTVANELRDARRSFAAGNRSAAYGHLEAAMNWALDLWSRQHSGTGRRPSSWADLFQEFMQEDTEPLRYRVGILTLVNLTLLIDNQPLSTKTVRVEKRLLDVVELLHAWKMRYTGMSQDILLSTIGARRIDRLDWAFLSEISAVTAILTNDPTASVLTTSRAGRLPVARREQVLRCLFRWLQLMDDHERLGVIPISRMKAVSTLNWDRSFVIELQVTELRRLLEIIPRTPEEERRYFENRQNWPKLFPEPPVPFTEERRLIMLAIELIESDPCPREALLGLAENLRAIQPRTRRRNRRRMRIADGLALYIAECFVRNTASETPDLYVVARLLTVCVPYYRLNRWRLHELERFADALAERYFGVSERMLRNAIPPPSLAESSCMPAGLWLWRDNGPIIPEMVTPYALVKLWSDFGQWAFSGKVDWRGPDARESYRQGLHLRTLTREQILLSPRRLAPRIRPWLDAADFDFLAGTEPSPHVWGQAWEQAYGNRADTHWWYYRVPFGFGKEIEKLI